MSVGESDVIHTAPAKRSPMARLVKKFVLGLFTILSFPCVFAFWVGSMVWGRDRSFLQTSEWMAGIPGMLGVYLRVAFYGMTLEKMGRDCYFGWLSTCSMPQTRIGNEVYVGRRCTIGFAEIGDGVLMADGVQILSGGREHALAEDGTSYQSGRQEFRKVTIGPGAWLGTNALIMANVGEGAIVGAGAVVTKPVPPRSVVVGVPAKVIRQVT
jgi:acetyltransferase-like isoleucine patch superfamily enzyme